MAKNRKSKKQNNRKPVSSRARNRRLDQRTNKSDLHGFEALEDRRLLATVTVGNSLDLVNGDTSSIANLIASPGVDAFRYVRQYQRPTEPTVPTRSLSTRQCLPAGPTA